MWRPNSVWQWALILIAFFQAAVVLSFEGYVFARFQVKLAPAADGKPEELTIPTFLTLFIFGCIYQLVLVIDALRLKNTIQVIGICLLNVAELVYAAIQKDQLRDAFDSFQAPTEDFLRETNPFLIAVPCVLAVGTVLMSFVAWKLYNEFAWTIYKHISADLRLKRRYLAFQIYIALLKFDFFFFLGFTVQFMVIMINIHDYEFGLTIAAIPVTILILFMAAYWTRKENRVGMVIIILLYFAALAYFLFKLIRMYQPSQRYIYEPALAPLTCFGVITVVLIVLTIINACVCMYNFGHGLMPHVATRRVSAEDDKVHMTDVPNYSQASAPNRMVID
ncbi:MAG: hypothetical protein M1815_002089 [Lichina confinis]|nr:MAG: hypothetical protein M1815_002089 [Lichina confinis]